MWDQVSLHVASRIAKLELGAFVLFSLGIIVSALGQSLPSCDATSSSGYFCGETGSQGSCKTYAILRANPRFSSLSNLSSSLGISRSELAEANGVPADAEFFSNEQPLLIPIDCHCGTGGSFEAQVRKITVQGENFREIAESLEGLTTCKAIREKNPNVPRWSLEERISLLVPLECACPSSVELYNFLVSYPVGEGDTLAELALRFNVSAESIALANGRHSKAGFKPENALAPHSTLLIPQEGKPILGSPPKLREPDLRYPAPSIQAGDSHKKRKPKLLMLGVYLAIGVAGFLGCLAIGAAFFFIHWTRKRKRKREDSTENGDLELQQLSSSVRTTRDKKVSFEGSQYNFDDPVTDSTTPRKTRMENYTLEGLQKATEDFSLSNLIEGSVYHGFLKGKNLAIKRVPSDMISRIDYHLFQERIHRHPNTIRLLGTCLTQGPDSYIVLEYAKNGSLKDWIHGGLAIKSHFIASCNCFLTWNQRVKICLDVATALQYMHHAVNPGYVHRNVRSRNIFLDEDFGAKVGNFGMSMCVPHEAKDQERQPAAWNRGYLPPEYIKHGTISPSVDVFAYGVVLLEVLSGKPPITRDEDGNIVKLSEEIHRILRSEDAAEELRGWIDGAVGEKYSFDAAVMLANLARSCVEDDPCWRPNAVEIVDKLLRMVEELPEEDQFCTSESSCKPLVKAAAKEM